MTLFFCWEWGCVVKGDMGILQVLSGINNGEVVMVR